MPLAILALGYRQTPQQSIIQRMQALLQQAGFETAAVDWSVRSAPSKAFVAEFAQLREARDALRGKRKAPLAYVGRSFGARVCTRLAVTAPPPLPSCSSAIPYPRSTNPAPRMKPLSPP